MVKISDIVADLSDFPFDHELTDDSVSKLSRDGDCEFTGFCSGDIIGRDGRMFFRAGYFPEANHSVRKEHEILMKLEKYDFVPRVYRLVEVGRYTILFTELIDAIDLSKLPCGDRRFKYGIKEGLKLTHRLYCDMGFVHWDLHPGNILIDGSDKVYLIDFTYSFIPERLEERRSWIQDLSGCIDSCDDVVWGCYGDLKSISGSIDPKLYLTYIMKYITL